MKELNVYLVTFNCARTLIQPQVFGTYIFDALPESQRAVLPDILVLNLQELAPISYSFLGGSFLTPYFDAFRSAVKIASGDQPYVNVVSRNLGMTAIMVFAKQDIASQVAYIKTAGVGVGVHEMGNKGAVGVRLGLRVEEGSDEIMESTFVAAHLAPMEDAVQRRNEDWENIVRGMVFTNDKLGSRAQHDEGSEEAPLLGGISSIDPKLGAGMFSPQSHLFFAGDLNYRTSDTSPGADGYKSFPTPTSKRGDASHYTSLLPKDQLSKQRSQGKTLHGLIEAPISFPPTYKYSTKSRHPAQMDDVDSWDWSRHRWPSWCDRILYLELPEWMKGDRRIQVHGYTALPLFLTSDHRPVALSATLPFKAIPMPPTNTSDIRVSPPYAADPDWSRERAAARRKELVVGLLAYLGLTWEGNGLLAATFIGTLGGYFIIKSLLAA